MLIPKEYIKPIQDTVAWARTQQPEDEIEEIRLERLGEMLYERNIKRNVGDSQSFVEVLLDAKSDEIYYLIRNILSAEQPESTCTVPVAVLQKIRGWLEAKRK